MGWCSVTPQARLLSSDSGGVRVGGESVMDEQGLHENLQAVVSDLRGSTCSGEANGERDDDTQHGAATTMQKSYRGYRVRRQLADCACVLARDYGWWNVLEGVILKKNLEVDLENDDVHQKWRRAVRSAAKVGRGLSQDENARQLAFQHWLEAIDPRHRYGTNLHKYYKVWQDSGTKEPFFSWLDVGSGRHVDLKDCPRAKLINEQIAYLGPKQRKEYEATVQDGTLMYTKSGKLIDTSGENERWIFVMSTTGKIYVGKKKKGKFQHSSFLAGGAAKIAGRLLVCNGVLQLIEPHSGHYRPSEEDFNCFLQELAAKGVDLTRLKIEHVSSDEDSLVHMESLKEVIEVKDKAVENGEQKASSSFSSVVEAVTSKNDDGASPCETSAGEGNQTPNNEGVRKEEEAQEKLMKRPSFGWTTESGARVSSLSIIPPVQRAKALEVVGTPHSA